MMEDTFPAPGVAAFAGHMTDAPDRTSPRFPERKVGAVRLAIRNRLQARQIGIGFSSAARGADLLFVQELLRRGGRPTVFLPFPPEDFLETSVGSEWASAYHEVLNDERVTVSVLMDADPETEAERERAYDACNRAVTRAAMDAARHLDERPVLITVWNGDPGDGKGGTADAVRAWRGEGLEVDRIDVSTIEPIDTPA